MHLLPDQGLYSQRNNLVQFNFHGQNAHLSLPHHFGELCQIKVGYILIKDMAVMSLSLGATSYEQPK
jgi:hypothetical protein